MAFLTSKHPQQLLAITLMQRACVHLGMHGCSNCNQSAYKPFEASAK